MHHPIPLAAAAGLLLLASGCARSASRAPRYVPHARNVTLTAVPILTRELRSVYPFLAEDFAPTGVLAGKEVYAFLPSTIVVVEGDTINFEFINPEDDVHSFVLPDLVVPLPPESRTTATYVARRAGVYAFKCSVAAHLPSMWGQLVVLSPSAVTSGASAELEPHDH